MVDIMPKISGVEFEEAWRRRVDVRIDDDLSVPFISREDLLIEKLRQVEQEAKPKDLFETGQRAGRRLELVAVELKLL